MRQGGKDKKDQKGTSKLIKKASFWSEIAWLLLSVRKEEVDFIDEIMNPFRYMKTPI